MLFIKTGGVRTTPPILPVTIANFGEDMKEKIPIPVNVLSTDRNGNKILGYTKITTTQIYGRVKRKKISEDMKMLKEKLNCFAKES